MRGESDDELRLGHVIRARQAGSLRETFVYALDRHTVFFQNDSQAHDFPFRGYFLYFIQVQLQAGVDVDCTWVLSFLRLAQV